MTIVPLSRAAVDCDMIPPLESRTYLIALDSFLGLLIIVTFDKEQIDARASPLKPYLLPEPIIRQVS